MSRATASPAPDPIGRTMPERAVRALRARLARGRADGGFMLIEVLVALTLITVIMAAVGVEYVNGIAVTAHERTMTNAQQVASTAVGQVRSLDPSDLLTGRTQALVQAERTTLLAVPKVAPWISGDANKLAYNDGTASAVNVATKAAPVKPGVVRYSVYTYFECTVAMTAVQNPDGHTTERNCAPTGTTNSLRAVVAVVWSQRGCPSAGCAFVTSTLINTQDNPTFDLNQPLPAAPIITTPGDQTVAVGDQVSLQLLVKDGTGVAPFTWVLASGSLPSGLAVSPAGLISGTVGGSAAPATSVTIQLTDAFLRPASVTFNFTVVPQLKFATVTDRANTTADSVSLGLSASGGTGAPYVYSDPHNTLPPGLTVSSAGTVTGRPSKVGTYPVTLTVADNSVTRTVTTSFSWTVSYPPVALTNPGSRQSTVGTALGAGLQLAASGGSGSFTFAAPTLPAGLSISPGGLVTGTPSTIGSTSASVTVTDNITGTVTSQTFTWGVVAAPTIKTPGDQKTTVGGNVSVQVSANCPNTPCVYSINNQPTNIVIDPKTGAIGGSPAANASTSTTVTVSVTDASGAVARSGQFTWTVYQPPGVTAPATQRSTQTGSASVSVVSSCSNGPCSYALSNQPTGLGIDSGTGKISGTINANASTSSTVQVTITDASNVSVNSGYFTWNIYAAPTITTPQTPQTTVGGTASVQISAYCPNGGCIYAISGQPTGLTINSSSGLISGTVGANATTQKAVLVTVRDSSGVSVNTNTFTWTINSAPVFNSPGNRSTARKTAVSLNVSTYASGGTPTLKFTDPGSTLPSGLSISQAGLITGTTSNARTSYNVKLAVTDGSSVSTTTSFTWTVT